MGARSGSKHETYLRRISCRRKKRAGLIIQPLANFFTNTAISFRIGRDSFGIDVFSLNRQIEWPTFPASRGFLDPPFSDGVCLRAWRHGGFGFSQVIFLGEQEF